MAKKDFHTFNEYMRKENSMLTASMEDYLEMIYRLSLNTGFTRIHELSNALNVKPSSATKMVQKLSEIKLLKYEKYGVLILEDDGKELGRILLNRHIVLEKFLKVMQVKESEILEVTEKIEHMFSRQALECFEDFIKFAEENPEIIERFKAYRKG